MIKKIFGWALFAGLTAVLVFGAVNRTQAIANEHGSLERNQGAGREQESTKDGPQISGQTNVQGQERSIPEGEGVAQNENLERFSLLGSVSLVSADTMTVATADGSNIDITGRTWSYAQEMGFSPQYGDNLQLMGFYETPDHKEVSTMVNLTSGESVVLRDENGRPMWAGWRRSS